MHVRVDNEPRSAQGESKVFAHRWLIVVARKRNVAVSPSFDRFVPRVRFVRDGVLLGLSLLLLHLLH